MPSLTRVKIKSPAARTTRSPAKKKRPAARKPSKTKPARLPFGEWARQVSGMMKGAPRDLSTREGFGD